VNPGAKIGHVMIRALGRTVAVVFATIAVLGIGAAYFRPADGSAYFAFADRSVQNEYRTAPVERGPIATTVAATGTLQAVATVLVGTQVSGQISEILADFNADVKKGDVIARIDPLSFQNSVEKAEAEVGIAEATLKKAQVALRDAEDDEQRKRKLTATGAGSAVELSKAMAARGLAAAEVQNAAATVDKSKAELKQALLDLERSQIRSPVNGVVIQRNVERGQTVAAELQAPTLFVIAQDLKDMQVELSVDEADIGGVKIEQSVTFTVDTFPGREFSGRVVQIRKYPLVKENVTTYVVIVSAPNPDLVLLPGLTALATIVLKAKDDVLRVPSAALRFRPKGTPFSGPAVWILGLSGLSERRVDVGISSPTVVEVKGNIQEGESVVVSDETPLGREGIHWTFGRLR
jgi:HlyD family secretion protein